MKAESKTFGVGFPGLLAVAFIVLKLCGVIGWSWWWVLAPLWAPLVVVVLLAFLIVVVKAIRS
jgi:hypothetical protein